MSKLAEALADAQFMSDSVMLMFVQRSIVGGTPNSSFYEECLCPGLVRQSMTQFPLMYRVTDQGWPTPRPFPIALFRERYWPALCMAIGRPELGKLHCECTG